MKKLLTVLVFASMAYLFPNSGVVAQPASSFKVVDMPGFPDLPADSAFEGQSYSFSAVISNGTNFQLNGVLELVFRVDTVETIVFSNPATTILAGDSISVTVSQYAFTQQLYQAGNNIVVVWPRITGTSPQIDTLYTNVYFVPLSSVGFPKEDNYPWINVFPNPAQEWTTIGIPEKESVEYVRILDVSGKLIREIVAPQSNRIHTGQLAPGVYFVQALSQKKVYRSSFIRMR